MARIILALSFLVFASPLFAQYEIRKSTNSFLIVSKVPGRTFTLNVPGKNEASYYKVPLSQVESHTRNAGGRTVLVWSYVPTFSPRPVRQIFLTLRAGSYVVVIGSAVQSGQTRSSIEALLTRIGASFHAT